MKWLRSVKAMVGLAVVSLGFWCGLSSGASAQSGKPTPARPTLATRAKNDTPATTPKEVKSPPTKPATTRAQAIASLQSSYPWAKGLAQYERLSSANKSRFQGVFNRASDNEKHELMRALGVGHDLDTIAEFAGAIRGKDAAWIRNTLRLANSTSGRGVRQQWSMSCGPTTVQAFLGELDPIYSLNTRTQNPNFDRLDEYDAMRFNPNLAREQKRMLESASPWSAGGVAVSRKSHGGQGRGIVDLLNQHTPRTGLEYAFKYVNESYPAHKALADLDTILEKRIPAVLHTKTATDARHFCLIVGLYHQAGRKQYIIHDPWTGQTVSRGTESFLQNRLRIDQFDVFNGVVLPTIKNL